MAPDKVRGKGLVLLVEDKVDLSELQRQRIELAGYVCRIAASAAEACNLLQQQTFDVLICDWVLGTGSAREVVRFCQYHHPRTSIIMTTGSEDPEVYSDILAETHCLHRKPGQPDELIDMITWWLARQGSSRSLALPNTAEDVVPLEQWQRKYVRHVVELSGGNISLAAKRLSIHRQTVTKILESDDSQHSQAFES